ncbi:M20 family metallopeptidase [Arthrobacter crystallopoietes]|uniref:M20 family metallopeptidase n=1 Tax=Crystallibacter crystallopoietes TaxID=37928 RepID=UPI00196B09A5|nr:M20 family metallopeptidase [Arthrobacter crystallopoietes]
MLRSTSQTATVPPKNLGEMQREYFDSGEFFAELSDLVSYQTVSPDSAAGFAVKAYLELKVAAILEEIGCTWRIVPNDNHPSAPFLLAHRFEGQNLPTVLVYGHADVVEGQSDRWSEGLSPWELAAVGDRWYGRGTADNKGQHLLNLAALRMLVRRRGHLGFNLTVLIESGEEVGSPGLAEFAVSHRDELQADVFIGSDGPRLDAQIPTLFLGARGGVNIELEADLRAGQHHSGNWGGVLRNAATTVAGAVGALVNGHGEITCEALLPPRLPDSVRTALASVNVSACADGSSLDEGWANRSLSPAERLFGWNTVEVLALDAGNAREPMNAIPGRAKAVLQLRFVVGTDTENLSERIREHLDAHGYSMVQANVGTAFPASRTDPDDPWARWGAESLRRVVGEELAVLPNIGGSLPNYIFTDILGLPTLWVPHSYPGCNQHAPDEHLLESVAREGLAMIMALFTDLGTPGQHPNLSSPPLNATALHP